MSLVDGLSSAVSGLLASAASARTAAENIVNAQTDGYRALDTRTSSVAPVSGGGARTASGNQVAARELGSVDVALEFTTLIQAENAYKASAHVIDTVNDLYKRLIDIRG